MTPFAEMEEALRKEKEGHAATAKQLVDMQAVLGCSEKKIAQLENILEGTDEAFQYWKNKEAKAKIEELEAENKALREFCGDGSAEKITKYQQRALAAEAASAIVQNRSDLRDCHLQDTIRECRELERSLCKAEDERDLLKEELNVARDVISQVFYVAKCAQERLDLEKRINTQKTKG